jgi:hypothetical protein
VSRRFVFASWEELPQAIKDTAGAQSMLQAQVKSSHNMLSSLKPSTAEPTIYRAARGRDLSAPLTQEQRYA